ncbi:glycosyltransferase [Metabacillus halosaccharovorans]|uniref:glycosyltransferase n=1 Tax=Metabacillus halosaccharovorans TaxID=930124 RepID=UPI0037367A76
MKKKVIIFGNPYKPMAGIGTKRISKFVKYLPKEGWEPIVFAPKVNGSLDYDNAQKVETNRVPIIGPGVLYDIARKLIPRKKSRNISPSSQKKETLKNVGARRRKFNDWLFIPDEFNLWSVLAGYKAVKRYKQEKENIKVCFATGPYFSTFLSGYIFSKLTGVPLVLDFRDPWIGNKYISYKTKFHEKINISLEARCIKQASKVITVSPHVMELFKKRYPQFSGKFTLLYNGYDVSDIEIESDNQTKVENTVITYTGTFYGDKNPTSFLKAINELIKEDPQTKFQVNFVGGLDSTYKNYIEKNGLAKCVHNVGYVPYEESLKYQSESSILLLIPGPDETTLPGKFYEYLYLRKPILCVGIKNSAIDELLKYTNSGVMADNDNISDVKAKLKGILNNEYNFTFEHIEEFNFELITQKVTEVLDQASGIQRVNA